MDVAQKFVSVHESHFGAEKLLKTWGCAFSIAALYYKRGGQHAEVRRASARPQPFFPTLELLLCH